MIKHFAIIALSTFLLIHWATGKANPPNVLLITADDLNWDSLGCTGNPLPGLSPNIDKLASEGILIENCHIATPICGPSREALYTGQFPQSNGYMGHGVQPPTWWKTSRQKTSTESIATILNKNGYLTGVVGKHGSTKCKFSVSPFGENNETGMGRDPARYFSFIRDFLKQAKEEGKPFYLAANTHDPHRFWARHPSETSGWINTTMKDAAWKPYPNGKPYPDPNIHYTTDQIPMPPSYPNDSRFKESLSYYFGSVNRMDMVVGEILRALDESELADNTIVLFLSDHGLAWEMSKWSLYPSGTKTPLIVRWPNNIKSKQIDSQSVLSVVDIAPTLAEICRVGPMLHTDGMSFKNLLSGDRSQWKRKEAFSCFNYLNNEREHDQAISAYTDDMYQKLDQYRPSRALSSANFTYIWNAWSDGRTETPSTMGREFTHLLKRYAKNPEDSSFPNYEKHADFISKRIPEEFYDVSKDPGCLNNLADAPAYRVTLNQFRKKMKKTLRDTQDHEFANYETFLSQ
jgi:N-sulfoglucosamine sulfohydrolase